MRYRQAGIQTLRQAPNLARTEGEALLFRASFFTPQGQLSPLGERVAERLRHLCSPGKDAWGTALGFPVFRTAQGNVYACYPAGKVEGLHCPRCGYFSPREEAEIGRLPVQEEPRPLERVWTPQCNTIESLAQYLQIPTSRTAKALMFTRVSDGGFVFVVVRGDTMLNQHKLQRLVGEVRPATEEEIRAAGAVPGYASPLGLKQGRVLVDAWIPLSPNLVAGANEEGYHLKNTNYGRDYSGDVADLILAAPGDLCPCGEGQLQEVEVLPLQVNGELLAENVMRVLAEVYHDAQGLRWPARVAPFDVYLLHVPGRELDTAATAAELSAALEANGLEVLLDDRDERAGVKFTDADLLGLPWRLTVGERALKEGEVEVKNRHSGEMFRLKIGEVVAFFRRWKEDERSV